jgi:hypothetical protein
MPVARRDDTLLAEQGCGWDTQKASRFAAEDVAICRTGYQSPLRQEHTVPVWARFAWQYRRPFYPCSVVKLFWLPACRARPE